tara:strand:- start:767 stop:1570 length:804 start_codon:yes stop_codon:yes gene_type:complete
MKLKHNKKRNTAFVYEVLIKELSKATMSEHHDKKNNVIDILKNYFSKGTLLREELEIYKSFESAEDLDKGTIEKIISEARSQAAALDQDKITKCKNELIGDMNKRIGRQCWDNFVKNYKKMATINQTIFQKTSPKNQVFLEKRLLEMSDRQEEKQQFPTVNKLALKTFLQKFNNEYSNKLNENQRTLMGHYITSYKDDGLEFKSYLYQEVDRLKEGLQAFQSVSNSEAKIDLIIEKMSNYSKRKIDKSLVTEIVKIQSLLEELQNGN